MKVVIAQLGARRHYAVARILYRAGILEALYTDISSVKGWSRCFKLLPNRLQPAPVRRLLGRVPAGIPADRVIDFPEFGCQYAWRWAVAKNATERSAVHLWAGREFCRRVIRAGVRDADAVYGFNFASLELFDFAGSRGLFRVLDQTLAPKEIAERLLEGEHNTLPDWVRTGRDALASEVAERERAEWDMADLILCGSEFVKQGVAEVSGPVKKCVVVPYGGWFPFTHARESRGEGPLRVLFVGGVGARKGGPYVLAAAQRFTPGGLRLRLVGAIEAGEKVQHGLFAWAEFTGLVPRAEMSAHYEWADVFVFPSICEGSAMVTYEALAAGLPVITTANAGSVVRDGIDGFIVPIQDSDAVAQKLQLLVKDRELLSWMSGNARERSLGYTLEKYGERLVSALVAAAAKSETVTRGTGS